MIEFVIAVFVSGLLYTIALAFIEAKIDHDQEVVEQRKRIQQIREERNANRITVS